MTVGIELATQHYRAGRLAEAIAACRAVLAAAPRHADTLNLLGAALFSAGDDGGALEVLSEAIRIEPAHTAARTNLIVVLQHRQEWAAAGRSLRALAALQPDFDFVYSRLGSVLQEMGDLDGSLRFLARAARIEPRSNEPWFNLGTVRILAGDFAGACDDMHRTIAANPGGSFAYGQLGQMLLRLGCVEQSDSVFRHALLLDPTALAATNGLARGQRYRAAASAARSSAAEGGLVVRGAFGKPTGYGYFCQRFIQTLRARGVPLQAIGIMGPESWSAENLDRPVPAKAMLNCLIPLAIERVPGLASVTFSMFEGTRIPQAWRRQSEHSDLIIVPCESSRIAWAAQGYPEDRLRVCPLGVDPVESAGAAALTLVDPTGRLVSSYRHRFLNISDFIPRKNIDGLLRVWLRSTTRADDAVLVLKLGKGDNPSLLPELGALVRQSEAAVGKRLADAAPVVLIDQPLTDVEMTGLVRAGSHYWSMSHGEGWDLPMSKAGAMGLSLIAPRHSAYVDYLDDRVARLIPATVRSARLPYSEQSVPMFHGLDWWNPDEDVAAGILADIISGRDAEPRPASDHLLQRFTWGQATDRLLAILDEAHLR